MKKLVATLIIALASTAAMADHYHYYRGNYYHGGYWGGPALVTGVVAGAVIGSAWANPYPQPVIVEQPPIYVQPQPVVTTVTPPVGYHYQTMINPQTNQSQLVLVPN